MRNTSLRRWAVRLPYRLGCRRLHVKFSNSLILIALFIVGVPIHAATGVQKTFPTNFDAVWAATIGALQVRGDPIIYSERTTGIITTDYKTEDEDWRHKFNLLLTRSRDTTTVSVSCIVEEHHGSRAFTAAGWEDSKSNGSRENQLLDAIARRLRPGGAAADMADANCKNNFYVKGSVVRGTTYGTFVEVPGLSVPAAIDRLMAVISHQSLAVLTSDKNSGTLTAAPQSTSGKTHALDFTVTATQSGIRVAVVQKLRAGDRGHDDAVREQYCNLISSLAAAVEAPSAVTSTSTSASQQTPTIEDRLRKLDDLYKKGLITEEEYKKKRAELLSQM